VDIVNHRPRPVSNIHQQDIPTSILINQVQPKNLSIDQPIAVDAKQPEENIIGATTNARGKMRDSTIEVHPS
jgi:hypothetical protein